MRPLGKEYIIVAEGAKLVNFNKMISLNQSAAYLWSNIEGKEFTAETLCDLLLARYEVDKETASKDSEAIIAAWLEAGIVEE